MAELKFKFIGDDTDIRKKLADLAKLQGESGQAFQKAFKNSGEGARSIQETLKQIVENTKKATTATAELSKAQSSSSTNAAKEAQLAYMGSLRQSRLEIQKQREEQARLRVSYDEGRISQQQYRIEAAKFSLEERKKAAALREAKKEISNNSEYQKLNRALGALRTESKNLLAEMYSLETQGKKGSAAYQELANKARGVTAQTKVLDGALKKIDTSLGLHQRNVGNYGSALDAISPHFARVNSQMQMMGINLTELAGSKNAFRELGATILGVGKNIGLFLISPVGLLITAVAGFFALLRGNASTVKEFNSGLLNVSKTTGIAGLELDKLSKSIIQLSRDLKTVSTDKLLEYATVAGQLGVKGTANIMAFSEALAKLETASDIKGEEGGAEIARLLTLTDGGVQNVKAFGDEIVNLGNNFAATEKEILGNAEAIAQNTGLYKIGRQDILAYATATKAVGMEAEVVGSAFFRTLAQIEKYSEGAKGVSKILNLLGVTQSELKEQFKNDASGVFMQLVGSLNKINSAGGSVTDTLNQLGLNNVRDIRVLGTLASTGYGQLQRAMEDVRDAAGSLDQEFETASGKLVNQTGRIGIAWDNLVLNIENGTGAIGVATVAITGFFADMLEGLTNVVTSSSWGEFWTRVNPTNWGRGQAITDAKNWIGTLKEAKDTMYGNRGEGSGTTWVENEFRKLDEGKYNERLTKTIELYDELKRASTSYEAAVESGRLVEDKNTVKYYKSQETVLKNHIDNLKKIQGELGYGKKSSSGTAVSTAPELTEAEKKAIARQNEMRLKAQRSLQSEIEKVINESKRRQLTSDEEEIQSIKDKYEERRKKVQEFNSDPKNIFKVDGSGLGAAQKREEEQAQAKHQINIDKQMYAEKKVLFDEYQKYIDQVGIEEANKRFSSDLEGFKNYVDYLKSLFPAASDQSVYANKVRDELNKEIPKAEKEEIKRQQERFTQALIAARTHSQNLEAIEAEYQSNIAALKGKASKDQLAVLEQSRNDAVNAANAEALEKTEIFRKLYEDLDYMGTESARKAINAGREQLEAFIRVNNITGIQADELRKKFGRILSEFEQSVDSRLPEGLKSVASEIQNIASEVGKMNASFGDVLGTVGNIVGAVGNIKSSLSLINSSRSIGGVEGALGGITGALGIFGAMSGVMTGISSLLSQSARRQEEQFQHSQDFQLKQTEAMTRALDRQLTLIKDLYGTERLKQYKEGLKEIEEQQKKFSSDIEGKKLFTGDKYTDSLIKDLNSGRKSLKDYNNELKLYQNQAKNSGLTPMQRQFAADNARKLEAALKSIGNTAVLTGKETTKQLLDIYASLDEGTQKGIDELIKLEQKHKDTLNAMREEATGTSFQDLVSSIIGVYANGGTSAGEAFGEAFDNTMEQYLLRTFSREFMEDKVQGWYELFNDLSKEGLTDGEKEILRKEWMKIGKEGDSYFKDLQGSTGISLDGKGEGKGMSGIIGRAIQEDTANKWMGIQLNIYTTTKDHLAETRSQSLLMKQYSNYAFQNLNAALNIERNTANTVARLDTALTHLTTIANNTKPSKTARDLG